MSAARDRERFERLVERFGPQLLGYLLRRADQPADAADLLADVLLVAWRRLDDVPRDDEMAGGWLFGVARRTLANSRRGKRRHHALAIRLKAELETLQPATETIESAGVRDALARLRQADRELLTLIAWDGLTPEQAAAATATRPATLRKRLQRARERFRAELERTAAGADDSSPDDAPGPRNGPALAAKAS